MAVPSDQDVEQHGEEDDGHGGGDGDQDHLAALAGDGEGCWRAQRDQRRELVSESISCLFFSSLIT